MRVQKTKEQHKQAAKAIAAGEPIFKALVDAGYSPKTADQGRRTIEKSKPLRDALKAELRSKFKEFMELGSAVDAQEQENIARGRLLQNVMDGSDAGVQSAKLLWQDKRVNQLMPENQMGVIMISGGAAAPDPNTILGEVIEQKRLDE